MRLDRYISRSRIVRVESTDLRGALGELIRAAFRRGSPPVKPEKILNNLLDREQTLTTYLGNGVLMPHTRLPMKRRYIFTIGWAPGGIRHDGNSEYGNTRLIFLLMAAEDENNYLNVLASLARLFRERPLVDRILESENLETFRDRVIEGFGGFLSRPERSLDRFNRILLTTAGKIARDARCTALMIFGDTFAGGLEITADFPNVPTVVVSRNNLENTLENEQVKATIEVRSIARNRLSQLRSALLIGLTRGIFGPDDRLCCVSGFPFSNQLDTVMVVDVDREFQSLLTRETEILPPGVTVEVVERVLAVATELSFEGREGKPVGCLFIVGDTTRVLTMVKPLLLNPFYGYKEEDRNILNPFMDETIKELSSVDGAFVIRGDGVIETAGSLLHAPAEFYRDLPSGLGSRHAAAAAMSLAANCLSIVVSSSTGQVTLFRRGVMLPLLDKSIDR